MGTFTAQILIGRGHPNDDGLAGGALQSFWLSENSRMAWTGAFTPRRRDGPVWVPASPDHVLDVALAYVATVALKSPAPLAALGISDEAGRANRLELNDHYDAERHAAMVAAARRIIEEMKPKLVFCCFHGSHLLHHLDPLRDLDTDIEILTPTGTRLYSRWSDQVHESGCLARQATLSEHGQ